MKSLKKLSLLFAVICILSACKKENTQSSTPVTVRMTDGPGDFQKVNIDIIGVEFTDDKNSTFDLNVKAGVYNLLDFSNGLDTLIASGNAPSGKLSQVRLILGTNNSVMVDGVVYPLSTPSAMQSGLKLNVHSTLTPNVAYNLLLDFDANESIVIKGNGEYQLKPVIKTVSVATSGSIHGNVVTALALPATIRVTNGIDTYTTITNSSGYFLLKGITPGTYIATITPKAPFAVVTISSINISIGIVTELGAIVF